MLRIRTGFNSDPDPRFWWPKLEKIYSWKNIPFRNFFLFLCVFMPPWIRIRIQPTEYNADPDDRLKPWKLFYCPDLPASAILAMTVSSAGFIVSNVLPDTESTKALLMKSWVCSTRGRVGISGPLKQNKIIISGVNNVWSRKQITNSSSIKDKNI